MKRLGMVIGICLLTAGVPLWGQSITTVSARQQADEAVARAQAEEARARAQADGARARAQAEAARAKAQADEAKLAAEQQISPNALPDLQKALKLQTPFVQVTPFAGGGYSVQVNKSRTNDPLAALQVAPGTWWNNADTATRLNLTKDQQKKMDDIFQQFRLTLVDLNASLSKEELIMDPLIAAERLDEVKILTQIDRVAQARAELEKANSRMLLAIRQSLTMEQWTKIQSSPGTYRVTTPRR